MAVEERNMIVVAVTLAVAAGVCIGLSLRPAASSLNVVSSATHPHGTISILRPRVIQPSNFQTSHLQQNVIVGPETTPMQEAQVIPRNGPWPTIAVSLAFSVASLAFAFWRKSKDPRSKEGYVMLSEAGENQKTSDDKLIDIDDIDDFKGDGEVAVKAPPQADATEPEETETVVGSTENFGFETNTRQILDIVARSLYHDKEVFIRELISNASDAIEKFRYVKLISDKEIEEAPEPRVSLHADPVKNIFVIQDTGIGMTKEELVNNLGTIASSGSKQLMDKLKAAQEDPGDRLIGQFGVGFYSAFIVAKSVKVFTRSCQKGSRGYLWESDGHGSYTITEADGVAQGTKIIVELKDEDKDFSDDLKLEKIIQKYSNFIASPILLNGKRINTVEALWRKNPKDVTEEQYVEFYKYIGNAYDTPSYKLHYRVDAPVDVKAVLFVPAYSMEQPGRNRLAPSVNLYCKKVLIKPKCPDLLPDWMRFVVGVVDSEDLPLNVSREGIQDSKAFKKLGTLVTKRVLKWLADEADKDKDKYGKFFKEFGHFLKEGAVTDVTNKTPISKLLRFESSKLDAGKLTSFDEYIERFAEGQERIYFLHTPTRQTALSSPYYEQLKKKGVEVLFMYGQVDEFVMSTVTEYKGYKTISIENSDLELDKITSKEDEGEKDVTEEALSSWQCKRFEQFLKKALADTISAAKPSTRLVDSPAVISGGYEQAAQYRQLKMIANMQGKRGLDGPLGKQELEYNPKHPIIKRLYWLTRSDDPTAASRARLMAEQVYDNALIASGLLEDPRMMLTRLNTLLNDSLSDVIIGTDDEDVVAEVVEEEKKDLEAEAMDAAWESAQEQARKILGKGLDELDGSEREQVDRLLDESMRKVTRPDLPPPTILQPEAPDFDLDIKDADFTEAEPAARQKQN